MSEIGSRSNILRMNGSSVETPPESVRSVCIIKPSAFGDVVQTLPLVGALKARFPDVQVSWVINRSLRGLLDHHPQVDQVIPFDRHGGWSSWKQLLAKLRAARFDLVLDLQGLLRSAIMTQATAAPLRIGLETAREGSSLTCHFLLPETSKTVPAHARYWRVAEWLGIGDHPREAQIPIPSTARTWSEQQLALLPGPVLAIHPGARWSSKRWPAENFTAIANRFIDQYRGSILLVGSEDETPLAQTIAHALPDSHTLNLCGETSIPQLAACLQQADLLLCNDSGPMHLAAALNTPLVGLFTSTDSQRSGPPPRFNQRLLSTPAHCSGCYRRTCPLSGAEHLKCLQQLGIESVWHELQSLLQQAPAITA